MSPLWIIQIESESCLYLISPFPEDWFVMSEKPLQICHLVGLAATSFQRDELII